MNENSSLSPKKEDETATEPATGAVEEASATFAEADSPEKSTEGLSELLDSALEDFGKARASQDAKIVEDPPDDDLPPLGSPFLDQHMAQQAAGEFQNMLRQLTEVQKVVLEQAKSKNESSESAAESKAPQGLPPVGTIASAAAGLAGGADFGDDTAMAEALLQNLQHLADKAQKVTEAGSEDEFMNAMQDLHTNTAYENDFLPFMQGLMGSLLSKEMMYPSLKEMSDKYPGWLEENKASLSASDLEGYSKQLSLIKNSCEIYESEKNDDSEEVKGKRFQNLINLMQQMQLCGQPPEELVGSMPPGWGLDQSTGLPLVTDSQVAAETCSIM